MGDGFDNRLRMVVITEEDKWRHLSEQLWQKGYTYFRWGGFPPWELDLPSKGDKVVFLYHDGERYFMYLMQTIAIGEQSIPFLEDVNELYQVDDCTVYVLSNVVGPIDIENNELKLPRELLKGKRQPDERVSQSLSGLPWQSSPFARLREKRTMKNRTTPVMKSRTTTAWKACVWGCVSALPSVQHLETTPASASRSAC